MAAASSSMIFDSLPYYDNDLEQFPILRAKVDQELAKEGQPPSELHPSLAAEYELFVVGTRLVYCAAIC
jgi:pre-mRNA-splicing factor SPF27